MVSIKLLKIKYKLFLSLLHFINRINLNIIVKNLQLLLSFVDRSFLAKMHLVDASDMHRMMKMKQIQHVFFFFYHHFYTLKFIILIN